MKIGYVKPDRDIRLAEIGQPPGNQSPDGRNHLAVECEADRDEAAREARVARLERKHAGMLALMIRQGTVASAASKAAISQGHKKAHAARLQQRANVE